MLAATYTKVISLMATAATLTGSGAVVVAQAVFDPATEAAERLVGGGLLLTVGGLIVWWTFRLLREVRANAAEDRAAALRREEMLLEQLARVNEQLAETNAQLTAERALRQSLEQMGLRDRRSNGD